MTPRSVNTIKRKVNTERMVHISNKPRTKLPGVRGIVQVDRDNTRIDYTALTRLLDRTCSDSELFELIVNAPFEQYDVQTTFLFLGDIVLLLVDAPTGTIQYIARSKAMDAAMKPAITHYRPISIDEPHNAVARAIRTGTMQDTTDWESLIAASPSKAIRSKQADAGITYSAVCPLTARNGGALIFSFYQHGDLLDEIKEIQKDFMQKYCRYVDERLKN